MGKVVKARQLLQRSFVLERFDDGGGDDDDDGDDNDDSNIDEKYDDDDDDDAPAPTIAITILGVETNVWCGNQEAAWS